jgi:hypothetical protein
VIAVTEAAVIAGVAFRRVATAFPVMLASLLNLAEIVTVFGLGSDAGAVNSPLASIVPVVALPPAVPFTAQVTFALVLET